ncbi:globin domain-containing protein [Leclercia adecarboxylata]|uniref:globin domain-containing protein n=1 Tax=Leclercia adecarboxylata TaxID=83655 RepID=UPI001D127514|nr:globin domain-containing protein [Leclercia adecarboxylata]
MGHQRSGAQAKALAGAVLAYAENIDDPGVLAPVIELICHKHVSLNIKAPDYSIVGENLLYSISEVLSVPMESPLISAWGPRIRIWPKYLSGPRKDFTMNAVTHPAAGWAGAPSPSAGK